MERIEATCEQVMKVNAKRGVVYGFAIVTKIDGKPYVDLQGEYCPDEVMERAVDGFAIKVGKAMHVGGAVADVVEIFALSEDTAKALGITSKRHGLIIGFKPHDPAMLSHFKVHVPEDEP